LPPPGDEIGGPGKDSTPLAFERTLRAGRMTIMAADDVLGWAVLTLGPPMPEPPVEALTGGEVEFG
jgi:hypothetical protein